MAVNRTILVVEDDPAILRLEQGLLARRGYQVLAAENGLDALPLAYGQRIDLVLLDLTLPVLSGLEFCRFVRKNRRLRDVPILIVTASDGEQAWRESIHAGASGFITKPFSAEGLCSAVERHVRPADTRAGDRVPIQLRVVYRDVDTFLQEYTLNIGRGGTFIRTPRVLDVGTKLIFHLHVPGIQAPLELTGEVSWVKKYPGDGQNDAQYGMGVRFMYGTEQQRSRLAEVVSRFEARTRVLLVDDDRAVLEMTKEVLERRGLSVFAVNNLIDLFFFAEKIRPDLVLLDMEMGSVRGDEVCRDLRQRGQFSSVPILLYSSLDDATLREAADRCGASGFIRKTGDLGHVGDEVEVALKQAPPAQQPITAPGGAPPAAE